MTKRIISALLCIIVLSLSFTTIASADTVSELSKQVADVKLYADENVKVGTEFTVTIYVENITATSGLLSNDLPLYYDRDRLTVVSVECIFPESWAPFGDFLGSENTSEYPYYLRSLPDTMDILTNPAYRVTESREIGYKVKFKANKVGEAFVGVENDEAGKYPIMLVSAEGSNIYNYGGKGETIQINVCEELPGGDASSEVSEDISISEEASSETSDDVVSGDDVTVESSEELSTTESEEDNSVISDEISADVGDTPVSGGTSSFAFLGIAGAAGVVVCILFIVIVIALAVGIVVAVVIFNKKKSKNN